MTVGLKSRLVFIFNSTLCSEDHAKLDLVALACFFLLAMIFQIDMESVPNFSVPAFQAAASSTLRLTAPFIQFPSQAEVDLFPEVRESVQAFLSAEKGLAKRHWAKLIRRAYPELKCETLENMLVNLVVRAYLIRHTLLLTRPARLHDFIEYCSGQGNLTLECLKSFLKGLAFDRLYSKDHDMCTGLGLRCWLDALAECNFQALAWFGTRCSSWVGLCRRQHGRKAANGYWGNREKSFVRTGNLQMVVTSLVMAIGHWSGVNPVLEAPTTSAMPRAEPLCSVLQFINASKHVVWLGAFSGESPKPLQIWSRQDLSALQHGRPSSHRFSKLCNTKGKSYSGNRKALHRSQAYTREFGKAVAGVVKHWLK